MIHSGVAIPAFLGFPVAALLLAAEVSGSPRRKRWLRGFAIASLASLLIFTACLAPVFSHHAPHYLGLANASCWRHILCLAHSSIRFPLVHLV
jgi:hypothetical protein